MTCMFEMQLANKLQLISSAASLFTHPHSTHRPYTPPYPHTSIPPVPHNSSPQVQTPPSYTSDIDSTHHPINRPKHHPHTTTRPVLHTTSLHTHTHHTSTLHTPPHHPHTPHIISTHPTHRPCTTNTSTLHTPHTTHIDPHTPLCSMAATNDTVNVACCSLLYSLSLGARIPLYHGNGLPPATTCLQYYSHMPHPKPTFPSSTNPPFL